MVPTSLELLVYNVSHSDVILGVKAPPFNDGREIFARPKFSSFQHTGKKVFKALYETDAALHVLHSRLESMPNIRTCSGEGMLNV